MADRLWSGLTDIFPQKKPLRRAHCTLQRGAALRLGVRGGGGAAPAFLLPPHLPRGSPFGCALWGYESSTLLHLKGGQEQSYLFLHSFTYLSIHVPDICGGESCVGLACGEDELCPVGSLCGPTPRLVITAQ